jgi:hypothetical protein
VTIKPAAFRALWIIGIPVLMIALSLWVPAFRNPLFLGVGALAGVVLSSFLLNAATSALDGVGFAPVAVRLAVTTERTHTPGRPGPAERTGP